MGIFEDLFPADMQGDIVATVLDPNGISPPEKVIQDDDDWAVRADWHIVGPAAALLGGEWTITVFAESIGPGNEAQLGSNVVNLNTAPATNHRDYTTTVNVPAGVLQPGVYRLVTVLNYANLGVALEIAGFSEGPFIQIYHKD